MSDRDAYDLIILGGGNALSLGIRAAKAGRSVAVVEKSLLGGTCPNVGCIPSKLLIAHADVARTIRDASRFHIDASIRSIDGAAVLREVYDATTGSVDGEIAKNLPSGLDLLRGHGRFAGPHDVDVTLMDADGNATVRELTAPTIVVATGTRTRRPQGMNDIPYWTSDDVFHQKELPRSMAIVGGGFIGVELGYFFHELGVDVTLLGRDPHLLARADRDARDTFTRGFMQRVPTCLGCTITDVRHEASGPEKGFHLNVEHNGGKMRALHVERLLYVIGRVPNSDDVGADLAGFALDEQGFIEVDDRLQTSVKGVYALGDVTGGYQFTHSAAWEATYLGDVLLDGLDEPLDYGPMPAATFSAPEVASVGLTEQELEAAGTQFIAVSQPYSTAAKGRAIKEQHGLCKFLLAPDGTILGCHIVGEHASVLVHQVIPVMKWRNRISSLTGMIHIHPSLSEIVRNTARKAEAALD